MSTTRYKLAEKVKQNVFKSSTESDHCNVSIEMARSAIQLLSQNEYIVDRDRAALQRLAQYVEHHEKTCGKGDFGLVHVDALRRLDAKRAGDAFILQMLSGLSLESVRSRSIDIRRPIVRNSLQKIQQTPSTLTLPEMVSFDFDPFLLASQTGGTPLSSLAYKIFDSENLIVDLQLNDQKLRRYLSMIESGYHNVPYHNSIHAADVLQRVHTILKTVGPTVFDKIDKLALYLAAVIHDYGHAGVTNNFLIASAHPLARQYNDRSPWENHHAASALDPLITMDSVKFLEALSKSQKMHVRRVVVDLVLATDMSRHVEMMKSISSKATTIGGIKTPKVTASHEVLCLALKCADVGHTTCEFELHKKWVDRLQEELYNQGDLERESGLPVSAMADRNDKSLTIQTSQLAFYDAVVLPMMHLLTIFFTGAQPLLEHACKNRDAYANLLKEF